MLTTRSFGRKQLVVCLMAIFLYGLSSVASAQLPQDVRDVFEGMLDDLDTDLQAKFKDAIKRDTSTVEFTPDQFRRFRADPSNPFQGLEGIDARDGGANIALKFELPSMRNRLIHPLERQSPDLLGRINRPVASAAASTVRVFNQDRQIALGAVIRTNGYILTKASEVQASRDLSCQLNDGRRLDAKLFRTDSKNDLAILKVNADGLPIVHWSDVPTPRGAFVLTPDVNGSVLGIGTYSAPPRSTAEGKQAFLGVKPETTAEGVRVSDIDPGTASHEAGLQNGDVITSLGGVRTSDVASLVKSIRDRKPGDVVEIEFQRKGLESKVTATLAGQDVSGEQAARFKMMNRLGAIPSRRDDNFPSVFQHDTPLFPEQCGGPITDLEGNVIGVNIARQGRAASYAIPARYLTKLLKDLLRENVAAR